MSDQLTLAETGVPTPPDLRLTPRQRFALEFIAQRSCSSEDLGAALHEYRRRNGGHGHDVTMTCSFCQPEGAHMGARLRELGLVRFSRTLGVWYVLSEGPPKIDRGAQTAEIPF